ncbi:MAG TPA: energy transducer TonB [Thermoanaerobaculia bacterium]
MRRFLIAALLIVLGRGAAKACSLRSYQPDDILTNEPVVSSNGRYLVIERWYEGVKDFESARADTIMNFDPPASDDDPPPPKRRETISFAVYEANTRKRLSEFSIPVDDDGTVLVSDTGYVAIVRPLRSGCYGSVEAAHAAVTVIRPDGSTVARLSVADILTKSDIANAGDEFDIVTPSFDSEESAILVLAIAGHTRRIDLASAKLLDEKVDLIPGPGVFVDAATRNRPYPSALFDEMSSVPLTSQELRALARDELLPSYPDVAIKARIAGAVWVEVVVSEYGEILAARATQLPFGLSESALATVRKWWFRPLQVHGKHVKYHGEVAIHFERKVMRP